MTSPNNSQSSSSTVVPPATTAPIGVQNPNARGSNATGQASKGAPGVAGGLRQAVQELVSSVDCLCGEGATKDASGARRHLDQAKRILGGTSHENDSRAAVGTPASTPVVAQAGDTV